MDPHTAVGFAGALKEMAREGADRSAPHIVLGTAHPAKFSDAVRRATGNAPELPQRLQHILTANERFDILPNSTQAVAAFIAKRTRSRASSQHSRVSS